MSAGVENSWFRALIDCQYYIEQLIDSKKQKRTHRIEARTRKTWPRLSQSKIVALNASCAQESTGKLLVAVLSMARKGCSIIFVRYDFRRPIAPDPSIREKVCYLCGLVFHAWICKDLLHTLHLPQNRGPYDPWKSLRFMMRYRFLDCSISFGHSPFD